MPATRHIQIGNVCCIILPILSLTPRKREAGASGGRSLTPLTPALRVALCALTCPWDVQAGQGGCTVSLIICRVPMPFKLSS